MHFESGHTGILKVGYKISNNIIKLIFRYSIRQQQTSVHKRKEMVRIMAKSDHIRFQSCCPWYREHRQGSSSCVLVSFSRTGCFLPPIAGVMSHIIHTGNVSVWPSKYLFQFSYVNSGNSCL